MERENIHLVLSGGWTPSRQMHARFMYTAGKRERTEKKKRKKKKMNKNKIPGGQSRDINRGDIGAGCRHCFIAPNHDTFASVSRDVFSHRRNSRKKKRDQVYVYRYLGEKKKRKE